MTEQTESADLVRIVRSQANRCFGCGPGNPCGLQLQPEQVDSRVRATFTPGEGHGGWAGVVHGGIIASAMDEIMAYVLFFRGVMGVTVRMEIRYRRQVAPGDRVTVEAWMTSETSRLMDVRGQVCRGDELVAEASARFMKLGPLEPEALLSR